MKPLGETPQFIPSIPGRFFIVPTIVGNKVKLNIVQVVIEID